MAKAPFTNIDEIVCCVFLIKGNKTEAYKIYRQLSNMSDASAHTIRSQAVIYFNEDKIKAYIKHEQDKLRSRFGANVVKSRKAKKEEKEINYADLEEEEVRELTLETLFDVRTDPDSSPSDRITAVKNIADIMNAKKVDKPISETEKLIHYVLPADICEECPNREKIYEEHGYPATEEEIKEAFYNNRVKKENTEHTQEEIELFEDTYTDDNCED